MVMIMKGLRIGNGWIIHSQASINITCYLREANKSGFGGAMEQRSGFLRQRGTPDGCQLSWRHLSNPIIL